MPDIALTAGAKVTSTIVEKTATEGQKNLSSANSDFNQLLSERLEQHSEMTKQMLDVLGMSPQNRQIPSLSADGIQIQPSQLADHEIRTQGKSVELLTEWNRSALQMESIGDTLGSGQRFSPQELLSLQAGLASVVLEVELGGKAVEQGSNSFKGLMQQNIG